MLDTTISIRPMYVMAMALSSIYECMILDCFHPRWGGALVKILIGMLMSFLGGFKLMKISFFWVYLNWRHLFGVEKIAVIFLGPLKICVIFLGYHFLG